MRSRRSSCTAGWRRACATTGAPRRRGSPRRSPTTARKAATTRERSRSAATPATTRPGSSPSRKRRRTTTGPSARFERLPAEGRPAAAISLHRRRGAARLAQSRFGDATADFEAMLGSAREGPGLAAAERAALAGLCDTLFFAQRIEEMSARAHELLEAATRAGAEGDVVEAQARIGQVLVGEGRLAEAGPMLDEVIASARRGGPSRALKIALSYRGLVHYWQSEFQATEATCLEALSLATELGDGFYALAARMFLGLARANLGRISEALDDFADAIAVARRNDDRYWLPRLVSHLGLGAPRAGRPRSCPRVRLRGGPAGPGAARRLGPGVGGAPQPVRRRPPRRAGRAGRGAARRAPGEGRGEPLVPLDERAAARGGLRRALGGARRPRRARARTRPARGDGGAPRARATTAAPPSGSGPESALARGEGARERGRAPGRRPRRAARQIPPRSKPGSPPGFSRCSRRRLGDEEGARAAFAEAARAVQTIAAGTRDESLREGFLGLPRVREVLDALPPAERGVTP